MSEQRTNRGVTISGDLFTSLLEYFKIQGIAHRVFCDDEDAPPEEVEFHHVMHYVASNMVKKLEAARDGK